MENNVIRNLLRSGSAAPTGASAARILFSGEAGQRSGMWVCNTNASLKVYLKLAKSTSAVSVAADDCNFVLSPQQSLEILIGEGIEVWALNESGGATVSTVTGLEFGA